MIQVFFIILAYFVGVILLTGAVLKFAAVLLRFRLRFGMALLISLGLMALMFGLALLGRAVVSKQEHVLPYQVSMWVIEVAALHLMLRQRWFRSLASAAMIAVIVIPALFLFRAVAIEAFAMPTGSMAPVLMGDHAHLNCAHCGRDIYIDAYSLDQVRPAAHDVVCGNCQMLNQTPTKLKIQGGDRMLVEKWSSPRRWDLVVFQAPEHPDVKYIKRAVGLPGEKVELLLGDVYIDGVRAVKAANEQLDMWIPVHDSRFLSDRGAAPAVPNNPWKPAKGSEGWKEAGAGWEVDANDLTELYFDRAIDDALDYSVASHMSSGPNAVSDVRLDIEIGAAEGAGTVALQWQWGGNWVKATFAAGSLSLSGGHSRSIEDKQHRSIAPLAPGKRLSLAMRDGFATLLIDDRVELNMIVESIGIAGWPPRHPLEAEPLEPTTCRLSVFAQKCKVRFDRLRVRRDVYYTNGVGGFGSGNGCTGCTGSPIRLSGQEYYMLGDNSQRSYDSRLWRAAATGGAYQVGAVPRDHIIGVARWLYWPTSRWHTFE